MAQRLQKIIAESGLMSRRASEAAILEGRVTVNGITAEPGMRAELSDRITVDGKPLNEPEKKVYYMLNKPRGYVCSLKDEKGRRSVRQLLPESLGRIYPVGRLDIMSEGLLLMSNDGAFAQRVTHPSGELHKTYHLEVSSGQNSLDTGIQRLSEPFRMDEVTVQAVETVTLKRDQDRATIRITIREGRNRQIRRMCETAGLRVERLTRIAEGPLTLGKLAPGHSRPLTEEEVRAVMEERT